MTAFADLHVPGDPLVLPNAWDHASAASFAAAGFPAVGTTSLGVAARARPARRRRRDRGRHARAGAAARAPARPRHRGHRERLLTDPAESPSTSPGSAAWRASTSRTSSATRRFTPRSSPRSPAATSSSTRASTPTGSGRPDLDETLERARAYVDAGADGIFVPGVKDEREIATLAETIPLPLNVLFGAVPVPRLAELGVARISTGSLLYRVALGAAERTAAAIRAGGSGFEAPSYAEVDGLART